MRVDEPLISVIMPAYNCSTIVGESIDSVLQQTFINWELIVVDDGSKDNTHEIISEYGKRDPRIKAYTNNSNQGVSATRNRAISLAEGKWLAFLDSDDLWVNSKLEKQMHLVNEMHAEFVFTGASYINEAGEPYEGKFAVPETVTYEKLRRHNVISCSSVLIKKQFLENFKMERDELHEDFAVWLRILRTGVVAYGINEPLLIYRVSRHSKSGNKLKSIVMTYKVFRFIGLDPLRSSYFTVRHTLSSLEKYRNIFR